MLGILDDLADAGVVVVASAGNDATDRPCFPAGVQHVRRDVDPGRLGGGAQPQPVDRRAVQQRRAVGDDLPARCRAW